MRKLTYVLIFFLLSLPSVYADDEWPLITNQPSTAEKKITIHDLILSSGDMYKAKDSFFYVLEGTDKLSILQSLRLSEKIDYCFKPLDASVENGKEYTGTYFEGTKRIRFKLLRLKAGEFIQHREAQRSEKQSRHKALSSSCPQSSVSDDLTDDF